jgi:GT2 family glycosyltransferase
MNASRVSIVIPTRNGKEHLLDCLPSVARQTIQPRETIVVDNASTDGTTELIRSQYSWVKLVQLDGNYGFAYAVNRGIEASVGEYVALLNDDTEVDQDWLRELVAAVESDLGVGSVASKMVNFYDRNLIDAAGDGLGISGVPTNHGQGKPDAPLFNKQKYVFGACAGAALYRRSCISEVGLLDEDFASHFRKLNLVISHFEDVDLAYRLQLAGYRCLYTPKAICYHKRGATVGRAPAHLIQSMERNLVNLYAKDVPFALLLRLLPKILAARTLHYLRAVRSGRGTAFILGITKGIGQIPKSLPKRRDIQRKRKVPALYLGQFMQRNS